MHITVYSCGIHRTSCITENWLASWIQPLKILLYKFWWTSLLGNHSWSYSQLTRTGQSNFTKRPHRHRNWTVVHIVCNGPPLMPQNCPFPWFLGPTWVHIPNGISIGLTIFVWLWQMDRATLSVTIGHIYVELWCDLKWQVPYFPDYKSHLNISHTPYFCLKFGKNS